MDWSKVPQVNVAAAFVPKIIQLCNGTIAETRLTVGAASGDMEAFSFQDSPVKHVSFFNKNGDIEVEMSNEAGQTLNSITIGSEKAYLLKVNYIHFVLIYPAVISDILYRIFWIIVFLICMVFLWSLQNQWLNNKMETTQEAIIIPTIIMLPSLRIQSLNNKIKIQNHRVKTMHGRRIYNK